MVLGQDIVGTLWCTKHGFGHNGELTTGFSLTEGTKASEVTEILRECSLVIVSEHLPIIVMSNFAHEEPPSQEDSLDQEIDLSKVPTRTLTEILIAQPEDVRRAAFEAIGATLGESEDK